MTKKTWMFSPNTGGRPIPEVVRAETERRIQAHAAANYKGRYDRIQVRFRNPLCYIDAYVEPAEPSEKMLELMHEPREEHLTRMRNTPLHLCRLRFFDRDEWSLAFYTYSHEKYEPSLFPSGQWFGTPEEAFDVGAMYLR